MLVWKHFPQRFFWFLITTWPREIRIVGKESLYSARNSDEVAGHQSTLIEIKAPETGVNTMPATTMLYSILSSNLFSTLVSICNGANKQEKKRTSMLRLHPCIKNSEKWYIPPSLSVPFLTIVHKNTKPPNEANWEHLKSCASRQV